MPWWVRPLVALVFGIAGYQRAVWFAGRHGRTPWGWHPLGWGVLTSLSLFLGLVCLAVAERSGRRTSTQRPASATPGSYAGLHPGSFAGPGQPGIAGTPDASQRWGAAPSAGSWQAGQPWDTRFGPAAAPEPTAAPTSPQGGGTGSSQWGPPPA